MIIYAILSFLNLLLGFTFVITKNKTFVLTLFLSMLFVVPTPQFSTAYFFQFRIHAFEWFFVIVFISEFIFSIRIQINKYSLYILAFLLICLLINFRQTMHYELKSIVVDLKPFFLLMAFFSIAKNFSITSLETLLKSPVLRFSIFFHFLISSLIYVLLYINPQLVQSVFNIEDPYYLTEYISNKRYSDSVLILLVFIFLFSIVRHYKPGPILWISIILPVIYSGYRTLLIILAAVIIFQYRNNLLRLLKFGIPLSLVLVFSVYFFQSRFLTLLDFSSLTAYFAQRVSPYFIEFSTASERQFILGKGIGLKYFIPWFEYRTIHVDAYNYYLDNFYLTWLGKIGIMIIPLLYFIYKYVKQLAPSDYGLIMFFLFLLALTFTFTHQNFFFTILFAISVFRAEQHATS